MKYQFIFCDALVKVPVGVGQFLLLSNCGTDGMSNGNFGWGLKTRDILELENWVDSNKMFQTHPRWWEIKGGSFWRELLVSCESAWFPSMERGGGCLLPSNLHNRQPWQDYSENLVYCLLKFWWHSNLVSDSWLENNSNSNNKEVLASSFSAGTKAGMVCWLSCTHREDPADVVWVFIKIWKSQPSSPLRVNTQEEVRSGTTLLGCFQTGLPGGLNRSQQRIWVPRGRGTSQCPSRAPTTWQGKWVSPQKGG